MSKFIVRAPAITQILKRPFLGGFYRMQPSSSLELLAFNVAQRCAATCRAALRSTGRDAVQFIIVQFTVQFYSKLQLGVTNSLQRARFASHFNWNTVWLMHTKDFVVCCWSAQWLQWKSFWLCQEHMEVFRKHFLEQISRAVWFMCHTLDWQTCRWKSLESFLICGGNKQVYFISSRNGQGY